MISITEALSQRKIESCFGGINDSRAIASDGLLTVSDAVFECAIRRLGLSMEWLREPVENRSELLKLWGVEE